MRGGEGHRLPCTEGIVRGWLFCGGSIERGQLHAHMDFRPSTYHHAARRQEGRQRHARRHDGCGQREGHQQ